MFVIFIFLLPSGYTKIKERSKFIQGYFKYFKFILGYNTSKFFPFWPQILLSVIIII